MVQNVEARRHKPSGSGIVQRSFSLTQSSMKAIGNGLNSEPLSVPCGENAERSGENRRNTSGLFLLAIGSWSSRPNMEFIFSMSTAWLENFTLKYIIEREEHFVFLPNVIREA
ncbi:hypothetical protein TNCV_4979111 [Trichonephila clavipes]|nr:hypothetical protein TNCV_4979111 [Trichonephila clavipes]